MEEFNFDQLIREKVDQETEIHQKEIDASKPFVWAALQQELSGRKSLRWYHLAAAVLLITLLFSYLLISVQNNHRNEINTLAGKIDKLQNEYNRQNQVIDQREQQVADLKSEMNHLDGQLTELESREMLPRETIVYRTDTVYVRQVEYITVVEPGQAVNEDNTLAALPSDNEKEITVPPIIDDEIFPSNKGDSNTDQADVVKFRFGSFVAKNK